MDKQIAELEDTVSGVYQAMKRAINLRTEVIKLRKEGITVSQEEVNARMQDYYNHSAMKLGEFFDLIRR